MLISVVKGTGKNQQEPGQKSMADAPVLSHYSLLWNSWPKPTDALEHCHEGETNYWFSYLMAFSFDCISKVTKDVNANLWDRNFPHAAIPINYTSKFLWIIPVDSGDFLKLIRV